MLSADIEARGHSAGCPGCAALATHGRAIKPHNNERRERLRKITERILTGKARMSAYKDRVAENERLKERNRARDERGAGDVPMEPGNEEQMADRHAVASGEEEKQHEENRMRDVHIGKRGPETANEEQIEEDSTIRARSSKYIVVLIHACVYSISCMCGKKQDRPEPVLVQNSGHVDDDIHISALDVFYEMDGRECRYVKEVLDWYRDEDAGDFRRSELNESLGSTTCLNALEEKN